MKTLTFVLLLSLLPGLAYSEYSKRMCKEVEISAIHVGKAGPLVEVDADLTSLECDAHYDRLSVKVDLPNYPRVSSLLKLAHAHQMDVDIKFYKHDKRCTIESVSVFSG